MKSHRNLLLIGIAAMVSAQAAQMTDSFAARPKVTGGNVVFTGDSTSAGIEPGETAGMHGGERDHTVWAEWVAPDNGWVTFDSLGTSIKNPMMAVYVGTQIDKLMSVARGFDPDGSGPNPAWVRFPATKGTAYVIVMDSTTDTSSGDGLLQLNLTLTPNAGPPSVVGSDAYSRRNSLEGYEAWGVCNNEKGSQDPFEPPTIGDSKRTVWWAWTAPATGTVSLNTLESDFDTTLTVLAGVTDDGDPFGRLDEVSSNDDVPNDSRSLVCFQAEAGRSYQIVVDGSTPYAAGRGNVVLHLALEPNFKPAGVPGADAFARRGRLDGFNALGVANNKLSGTEAFEPEPPGSGRTIWWEWIAPATSTVVIDTFGSEGDTVLAVLTGTQLGDLVRIAYNRDAGGTTASQVTLAAQRGQSYQIVVDAQSWLASERGNIVLNVNQEQRESHPDMSVYQAAEIEVFARVGKLYQLQATSDWIHWEDWGEAFVGEDKPIRFFDSARANGSRFYRFLAR